MIRPKRVWMALAIASAALVILSACHRRARVVQGTSVVQTSTGAQAVTVSHRHYRNLVRTAARDIRCDARAIATQEVSPGIFAIQGCGLAREYVMVCRGRRSCRWIGIQPVEQVAIAETGCASGTVQIAMPAPLSRQVTACGQVLDYQLACGVGGCGWTRGATSTAMMVQSDPGTTVIVIPDDGSYAQVPPAPGSTGPVVVEEGGGEAAIEEVGAAGTLQSLLATQIAILRGCTGGQAVSVTARWTADGTVSIALAPPFAGTAVEACIQQAVGSVRIQAGAPGEVQATF